MTMMITSLSFLSCPRQTHTPPSRVRELAASHPIQCSPLRIPIRNNTPHYPFSPSLPLPLASSCSYSSTLVGPIVFQNHRHYLNCILILILGLFNRCLGFTFRKATRIPPRFFAKVREWPSFFTMRCSICYFKTLGDF